MKDIKICTKCGRELPNDYYHFPKDKNYEDGLRNICRECDKKYSGFLKEGYRHNENWSEEEKELLNNVYKDYTGDELIEKFFPNRTKRSLETYAGQLGISGKTPETLKRSQAEQAKKVSVMFKGRVTSEETKKKISESKLEYYKTHDGIRLGSKLTQEQKDAISKRVKEAGLWAGENNPRHKNPLNGDKNGRWLGGVTDIYGEMRSDAKEWQKSSMEFCGYKCVITNGEFDNIHHTKSFKSIFEESFKEVDLDIRNSVNDYTEEEINKIRCKLKYNHVYYGYGACLSKEVHKLFHDNYGYINASPYDFLDFIYKIDCGEFNQWFEENKIKININYSYVEYLESTLLEIKSA